MAGDFDKFSVDLLDEAKRFLEKASENGGNSAYAHAALVLGFSALESHINGIADELVLRKETTLLERSLLSEEEVKFDKGGWVLGKTRFFRFEDRISFLLRRYGDQDLTSLPWWSDLAQGIDARNRLVHPKDAVVISTADLQRYLRAIVEGINAIYLAVFGLGHPSYGRGLQSTMTF